MEDCPLGAFISVHMSHSGVVVTVSCFVNNQCTGLMHQVFLVIMMFTQIEQKYHIPKNYLKVCYTALATDQCVIGLFFYNEK